MPLLSFWKKLCLLLYTEKMSDLEVGIFVCLVFNIPFLKKVFQTSLYSWAYCYGNTFPPLFLYSAFDTEKLWDSVGSSHEDSEHIWRCLLLTLLQHLHGILSDLKMEIYNLYTLIITTAECLIMHEKNPSRMSSNFCKVFCFGLIVLFPGCDCSWDQNKTVLPTECW